MGSHLIFHLVGNVFYQDYVLLTSSLYPLYDGFLFTQLMDGLIFDRVVALRHIINCRRDELPEHVQLVIEVFGCLIKHILVNLSFHFLLILQRSKLALYLLYPTDILLVLLSN